MSIRAHSMMPAAKGCAPTLSSRLAAYKCKPPGRMAKRARGHQHRRVTCRAEDHKVYHTNLLELSSEPQCLSWGGIRTGDKTVSSSI